MAALRLLVVASVLVCAAHGVATGAAAAAEAEAERSRVGQSASTHFFPGMPHIGAGFGADAYGNPQALIHGGMNLGYMVGGASGFPTTGGVPTVPGGGVGGLSAYGGKGPEGGPSPQGAEQPAAATNPQGGPGPGAAAGPGFYREQLPNGMSMKVPVDFAGPGQTGVMANIMNSHVQQQSKLLAAIHNAEAEAHTQAHHAALAAMDAKAALWRLQQARRSAHYARGVLASLHRELAALDLSKERVVEQAHLNGLQNQLIASESLVPFAGTNLASSPLQKAITRSKKVIDSINEEIRAVLSPKDAPKALQKYQEAEKKEEAAHKELEAAAKLREESDALNTAYAPDLIAASRMKLAGMASGSGSGSGSGSDAFRFASRRLSVSDAAAPAAAAAGAAAGGPMAAAVATEPASANSDGDGVAAGAAAPVVANAAPAAEAHPARNHNTATAAAGAATTSHAKLAAAAASERQQVLAAAADFRFGRVGGRETHQKDSGEEEEEAMPARSGHTRPAPRRHHHRRDDSEEEEEAMPARHLAAERRRKGDSEEDEATPARRPHSSRHVDSRTEDGAESVAERMRRGMADAYGPMVRGSGDDLSFSRFAAQRAAPHDSSPFGDDRGDVPSGVMAPVTPGTRRSL